MSEPTQTPPTPEQIAAAYAIVAGEQARIAADNAAKRAAFMEPVTELVRDEDYLAIYQLAKDILAEFAPDDQFAIHLSALATVMLNLAATAGVDLNAPAAPLPPEPLV